MNTKIISPTTVKQWKELIELREFERITLGIIQRYGRIGYNSSIELFDKLVKEKVIDINGNVLK